MSAQLDCRDPQAGLVCLGSTGSPVSLGSKAEEGGQAILGWREIQARRVGEETLARLELMEFLARTGLRAIWASRGCLETGELMGARASLDCQEPLGSLALRGRWERKEILDISDPLEWLDLLDPRVHQEMTACQVSRVPLDSPNRKGLQGPRVVRAQPDLQVSLESGDCRVGRGPGGKMVRSYWELRAAEVSLGRRD